MKTDQTTAFGAARRFFRLAQVAAKHGGFWVSPAGGTANVVAGVIARDFKISVEDARRILDEAGREWAGAGWYSTLLNIQPVRWDGWDIYDSWDVWNDIPGRWDVRLIAAAACRGTA